MTAKTITGTTIANGYVVAAGVTALSITTSVAIDGYSGTAISKHGGTAGAAGGIALAAPFPLAVYNAGVIAGGTGGAGGYATTYGAVGGAGGRGATGVEFEAWGYLSNSATITGGAGGAAGAGVAGPGAAGAGAAGVDFKPGGTLFNTGSVSGGAGGAGGSAFISASSGGAGGVGGAGVELGAGGLLTNFGTLAGASGGAGGFSPTDPGVGGAGGEGVRLNGAAKVRNYDVILGGAGGQGGDNIGNRYVIGGGGEGGAGGSGAELAAGAVMYSQGALTGGAGGAGGVGGYGGAGGVGVDLAAGAVIFNQGAVTGGQGGAGGQPYDLGPAEAGGAGAAAIRESGAAEVRNYAVITGGSGGAGGPEDFTGGGVGGAGGDGVDLIAGATVFNFATILGGAGGAGGASAFGPAGSHGAGGDGVSLVAGGYVANSYIGAIYASLIEGVVGVYAGPGGAATVVNCGEIYGTGGISVEFKSAADKLIADAGSTFIGVVMGGGGQLGLGGVGTISDLGAGGGTLAGDVAMTFSGFGSFVIDRGARWTLAGANFIEGETLLDNGTLGIASGAALSIYGGAALVAAGAVINGGSIVLESGLVSSGVRVTGSATLSGGGVIELEGATHHIDAAGGGAVLTNLDNTITGTGAVTGSLSLVNGAAGVIDATGLLQVSTPGETLTNAGMLEATDGGKLVLTGLTVDQGGGGTILGADASHVVLAGAHIDGGTLATAGTAVIGVNAQGDTLDGTASPLTLAGTLRVSSGVTLVIEGSIVDKGAIRVVGGQLMSGAAGSSFSGGGQVDLVDDSVITVAASGATLTNADRISGDGVIGGASMILVNTTNGKIIGNGALILDTGLDTIQNAGRIEASGAGGTTVISAIYNTGTLMAATTGTLILEGAVTGSGVAIVHGGTMWAQGAFGDKVVFTGTGGTLELSHSIDYAGPVEGLDKAGTNALDLLDIGYLKGTTTASFSGTTASGILTVTDGTNTARIKLIGDYVGASFTLSDDGGGGTRVVDPPPASAFSQAMASFQPGPAPSLAGTASYQPPVVLLVHTHG
jgi:hypothetical protein